MELKSCQNLLRFLEKHKNVSESTAIYNELMQAVPANYISYYDKAIPLIENIIWQKGCEEEDVLAYQNISRELEQHYHQETDNRHHILIVIPVADRVQHLDACLHSIFTLCEKYEYGGKKDSYQKVTVLVAEDSKLAENQDKNEKLAEKYSQRGLQTIYFGVAEQENLLASFNSQECESLKDILGEPSLSEFVHKGASITRNITYIKLAQLKKQFKNVLFYFIDSDQEFQVNILNKNKEFNSYAVNYFYHIDKIFSDNKVDVLTGKVVGDPPVSPSVMADNFLCDVSAFLTKMKALKAHSPCEFHKTINSADNTDAAYHDMANLFGFDNKKESFNYQCDINGEHKNVNCFDRFASKLNQFFDGVHLTRKTYFKFSDMIQSIVPARTIYTGNYVFNSNALEYFIPFAPLKLRMAGPVMGRLIKDKIGERFVSANLPMLHGRILKDETQSEFRPGIEHQPEGISLAGEFERQFFGDVMLFSIEKILLEDAISNKDKVHQVVLDTAIFLQQYYTQKIESISSELGNLQALVFDKSCWWYNTPEADEAIKSINRFVKNMDKNFAGDSFARQLLQQDVAANKKITSIINAIMQYNTDVAAWKKVLKL